MKEPQTILIVDDVPENIKILSNVLRNEYHLLFATNGRDAVGLATGEATPDLILLDVMMPEMDGYEVCRRLQAHESAKHIPIIFVTALSAEQSEEKGLELGAVDYISKPYSPAIVKARIRTHLTLKSTAERLRLHNEELERLVVEESRQLVRLERQAAFGQMVQGIIHNLRTPLSAISCHTEVSLDECQQLGLLLEKQEEEPCQEAKSHIGVIQSDLQTTMDVVESLNLIIDSMMSRSSSDQSPDLKVVDFNTIVRQELEFFKANLDFKNRVDKSVQLCPGELPVKGVPSEIGQMVTNLVANALDAMHDSSAPLMKIVTERRGPSGVFRVEDSGCGIEPDNLERIFDPFFTTKNQGASEGAPKKCPSGTGLGLYSCLQTVNALGGEIDVQSVVGGGSTFTVVLPLALDSH